MRRKILCIDDDKETAALIAEELSACGFDVTTVHSGQDGLLSVMRSTPDLILCDIGMPSINGFELAASLRAIAPRLGNIPFIFLASADERQEEIKGRRLGADDCVTKPIDFDRLVFTIYARILGVARSRLLPRPSNLNDREIEALTWVARGKTSAEIARKLRISKRTIEYYIENARVKLHAATRTEAAIKAAVTGLIEP